MRKYFVLILGVLLILSCKPTFDIATESKKIQDFANGRIDIGNLIEALPSTYKDSLSQREVEKLIDSVSTLFESYFFKSSDILNHYFEIKKISSTKKIDNNYFKIIQLNEHFTIAKNRENIYLNDFKSFLYANLIKFKEDELDLKKPLITNIEDVALAYWSSEKKKWNYIGYNEQANVQIFNLQIAKELINLYFEEIFVSAKQHWNEEEINLFYEIYEESRNDETYKGLDFDKYCKCRIKYEEKNDKLFQEIPDEYYNSALIMERIFRCRIYSMNSNQKINTN